jgi:NAD(P)-dependent dehydrogenase (short-subunit alcohol dehydrogenase family)
MKGRSEMEKNLIGKTYAVTGATSGIGLAVSEELVRRGAGVIGVGRSPERCRQAERRLLGLDPQAQVEMLTADLSLQNQVRALRPAIQQILETAGRTGLDGLVNNAGTFTTWLELTSEGVEMQWAVNHLAPFLLTNVLLPLLLAAPCARVVTVSSGSHAGGRLNWADLQLRRRYNGLRAYENTKLANILFTLEFNRLLGATSSVKAFAADPGLVKTDIGFKGTPPLVRWLWKWRRAGGTPVEVPAKGIIFLLSEPDLRDSCEIYWKDSQPRRASPRALDTQAAARLWVVSERMCAIEMEMVNDDEY